MTKRGGGENGKASRLQPTTFVTIGQAADEIVLRLLAEARRNKAREKRAAAPGAWGTAKIISFQKRRGARAKPGRDRRRKC